MRTVLVSSFTSSMSHGFLESKTVPGFVARISNIFQTLPLCQYSSKTAGAVYQRLKNQLSLHTNDFSHLEMTGNGILLERIWSQRVQTSNAMRPNLYAVDGQPADSNVAEHR